MIVVINLQAESCLFCLQGPLLIRSPKYKKFIEIVNDSEISMYSAQEYWIKQFKISVTLESAMEIVENWKQIKLAKATTNDIKFTDLLNQKSFS